MVNAEVKSDEIFSLIRSSFIHEHKKMESIHEGTYATFGPPRIGTHLAPSTSDCRKCHIIERWPGAVDQQEGNLREAQTNVWSRAHCRTWLTVKTRRWVGAK